MLNQKLSKAIIICLGLLPMTAVNGSNFEKKPACGSLQGIEKEKPQRSKKIAKKKPSQQLLSKKSFSFTETYFSFGELYENATSSFPKVTLQARAAGFVKKYWKQNSETLHKIKNEGGHHFEMMDVVFRKYNMPVQLKYLAVIESELKSSAVSHVGAVGPWQFMPETARILGLRINAKTDERRSYAKSTRAAAIYLRDLYNEFDDWLLVIAAYNSGPGPVYKAIKKSGSRNFWNLQYHLPEETRNHVKKFIGAHYFFEGEGSITTLTRAEKLAYHKMLKQHILDNYNNAGKEVAKTEPVNPHNKNVSVMLTAKVN
ncbi:MAG: lytic transglycosylase domain-containing protein [Chitinophagaceae bacterium]|nr:lytic transglycosylase domain-containing protein [Chitinophagaceae bacterium]